MATDDPPEEGIKDEDKTALHRVPKLDSVVSTSRSPALTCISGRSIGQMFLLTKDETMLGRAPECDVFLDDEGVSRHHARVIRRDGNLVLVDYGSTNGTYYEGERVDALTLEDGAKFQIGTGTILQFRLQDQSEVQYHRTMQDIRQRDPMTEAFNKRSFLDEIEKETAFARRHNQPLALIMLDLDHFKRVNDTYGHQAGDHVLRTVAVAIAETMRREDIFARYGGEEFVVLLRNTPLDGAFIVAERIRRLVESLEITHNGRRIPCTASLGVAVLDERFVSSSELIESADDRLYQAKRKGRNRTESALFD